MKRLPKLHALDIPCAKCLAVWAQPCRGTRQPGPASMGGGWGGPPDRQRPHAERIAAAKSCNAESARWEGRS
jgi:hypothetical protein